MYRNQKSSGRRAVNVIRELPLDTIDMMSTRIERWQDTALFLSPKKNRMEKESKISLILAYFE